MNAPELKIEESNKLDELKKELEILELEDRLEMVQLAADSPCCSGCGGNGSCTAK